MQAFSLMVSLVQFMKQDGEVKPFPVLDRNFKGNSLISVTLALVYRLVYVPDLF